MPCLASKSKSSPLLFAHCSKNSLSTWFFFVSQGDGSSRLFISLATADRGKLYTFSRSSRLDASIVLQNKMSAHDDFNLTNWGIITYCGFQISSLNGKRSLQQPHRFKITGESERVLVRILRSFLYHRICRRKNVPRSTSLDTLYVKLSCKQRKLRQRIKLIFRHIKSLKRIYARAHKF